MSRDQLIVFVRAPRLGTVKTRLAKAIGLEAALAAYQSLTDTVLKNLESLTNVELAYTPDDSLAEIEPWRRRDWGARPQGTGDLGVRMHNAFASAFARGAGRMVLIGSDCPHVRAEDIRGAWAQLENHDLVVGPASDGGYWLIGLNAPQPQLFIGIEWSTDHTCADTLAAAKKSGLRFCLLRALRDIDTPEDWAEYRNSTSSRT